MFSVLVRKASKSLISTSRSRASPFLMQSLFCTDVNPPDEFFDEDVEAEKEFCDISMSLIHERGLEGINSISENYSWQDLSKYSNYEVVGESAEGVSDDPEFDKFLQSVRSFKNTNSSDNEDKKVQLEKLKEEIKKQMFSMQSNASAAADDDHSLDGSSSSYPHLADESDSEYEDNGQTLVKESKRGPFVPDVSQASRVDESAMSAVQNLSGDLGEQLSHLEEFNYFSPHQLNYSMPQRDTSEYPFEHLEDFVPDTDPSKFRVDEQGQRHCEGRKQRRGKRPDAKLQCHLIDLDTVHPVDIAELKRFMSQDGEILNRSHTGLCPRCQRNVARTIKQSRAMGLLPHLGALVMADARPARQYKPFHNVVKKGGKNGKAIMSKIVTLN